MKPTPPDWPRLSTALFYDEPARAIDWLCRAFGFEVRLKVEGDDGSIHHSELVFGEALIMVGKAAGAKDTKRKSPRSLGGANTQSVMIYVDDADAHCARARAEGAEITSEPEVHDYGAEYWADRGYACVDLEGHGWWFCQRVRSRGA